MLRAWDLIGVVEALLRAWRSSAPSSNPADATRLAPGDLSRALRQGRVYLALKPAGQAGESSRHLRTHEC